MKCRQTTTTALALALLASLASTATAQIFNSLEWLRVEDTTNISFDTMQQAFGTGGLYAGWRHATLAETWGLVDAFGYDPLATAEANAAAVEGLQGLLGITNASSAFQFNAWTLGFTANGTRLDIRMTIPNYFDPSTAQGQVYETDWPLYDVAMQEVGHYLVRSVPEPAHAALILALAALLLIRRRRRS